MGKNTADDRLTCEVALHVGYSGLLVENYGVGGFELLGIVHKIAGQFEVVGKCVLDGNVEERFEVPFEHPGCTQKAIHGLFVLFRVVQNMPVSHPAFTESGINGRRFF